MRDAGMPVQPMMEAQTAPQTASRPRHTQSGFETLLERDMLPASNLPAYRLATYQLASSADNFPWQVPTIGGMLPVAPDSRPNRWNIAGCA